MDFYQKQRKSGKGPGKAILLSSIFLGFLLFLWVLSLLRRPCTPELLLTKAAVVLSGSSNVTGTVIFEQSSSRGAVVVKGELKGLDPNALRGFHIHQLGDLTEGCLSAGPHFNPFKTNHGAPNTAKERHVGDLGNIKTDKNGDVSFVFPDSQLTLNGPLSIIGRAVVVHTGTDDLGNGGNEESLKTGNAGGRAACGVIGIAS